MFTDPQSNIRQFGLADGMHIADLGSGTGAYSLAAAKAIGGNGKVYAIDVQKDLLEKLKNEARAEHLTNIETIWGDIEKVGGTKLAPATVSGAIISNILFQLTHKSTFVEEVKRILKPGGRAFVVDWSDSFAGTGPQPQDVVSKEVAKKLFIEKGFKLDREFQAGAHHYALILSKL
ncbi:MAG: class I SAM-dependent methyltransferase [bacterium]|nr:class I SAM-dependent methyltransferase [bacterium]